jgi:hypothetical protein
MNLHVPVRIPGLHYPVPNKLFFQEIEGQQFHTSDMWYLERFTYQLMFVYNELLPGHLMHHLIEDTTDAVSTGYYGFTKQKYVLWKHRTPHAGYQQPLPLKVEDIGKASVLAPIKGFLYAVRPRQYYQIDLYMQNELYFKRERVEINVPYREINNFDKRAVSELKHEIVECWMYKAVEEYWIPLLDHGMSFKPVKPFIGKSPHGDRPYYYWTKLESEQ